MTPARLREVMEFDHVIHVDSDGRVSEPKDVYAPDVTESNGTVAVDPVDWELLTGWTGQWNYSGPVMHPSEFVGGRLADHILTTPGTYVTVVVTDLDELDADGESALAGWAIAYREDTR
ncbi:hypothetical protein [Nocardia puris]|nr:hypothetical protein [Nocardia puris]